MYCIILYLQLLFTYVCIVKMLIRKYKRMNMRISMSLLGMVEIL